MRKLHSAADNLRRSLRLFSAFISLVIMMLSSAGLAHAADPALSVPDATLAAALHCPATFSHPDKRPILLVHGTTLTYDENYGWNFAPALTNLGYDVCGVDLPDYARSDIQVAAEYVVYAIRYMNTQTSQKVDVVGHSQGPLEIRWALKWWTSLQDKVDHVVLLASPANGTPVGNIVCLAPCSGAGSQLAVGSHFNAVLNAGDPTPGATVSYTNIYSMTDELIVYPQAVLSTATNISIQNVCPLRVVTHFGEVYDALPWLLLLDTITHDGPGDPTRLPANKCTQLYVPGVTAAEALTKTALLTTTFASRVATATILPAEPAIMPYAQ